MSLRSDAEQRIVARIDKELGADTKHLRRANVLVDEYKARLREIKRKFDFEDDQNSVFQLALEARKRNCDSLDLEMAKLDALAEKMHKQIEKFTLNVIDGSQANLDQVRQLQKLVKYLDLIEDIQRVSNQLSNALREKNDSKLINTYLELCEENDREHSILGRLGSVAAPHLQLFAINVTHYWYKLVKGHLSDELEATLKTMRWGLKEDDSLNISYDYNPEATAKAQLLAEYLFLLHYPNCNEDLLVNITPSLICQPLSTVTKILLEPYKKRFLFHFTGTRKTNRLDKPEWFYTQILNWGKQVHLFVGKTFQPAALKSGKVDLNMRLEFLRGLVQMVVEKLVVDIDKIVRDAQLFAHLIDETLAFEAELHDNFGYPNSFPSAISVLTQPNYLLKWIALEEAFCEENIDMMLQNEHAWDVIDPHLPDDELKIPLCTDQFVRLLEAITKRYFGLIQPGHQLQFLSLQLQLLDSFRRRLVQLHSSNLLGCCSVLNSINYLVMVLREWGEHVHYLHLHTALVGPHATEINSVFDEPIAELEDWKQQMIANLAGKVFNEIKARTLYYRHDNWANMIEQGPKQPFILSPSSGDMFHAMVVTLHSLHRELSTNIFNRTVRLIARQMDEFLLDDLVLTNKFSTGGAEQFKYDVTRNMFTLFGQYINRPDLLFKKTQNATILLTLSRGTALLLHETLIGDNDLEEKQKALQELEILDFQPPNCIEILERRTDIKAF